MHYTGERAHTNNKRQLQTVYSALIFGCGPRVPSSVLGRLGGGGSGAKEKAAPPFCPISSAPEGFLGSGRRHMVARGRPGARARHGVMDISHNAKAKKGCEGLSVKLRSGEAMDWTW